MSVFSVYAVLGCVRKPCVIKGGFVSAFCCPAVLGQFSRGGWGLTGLGSALRKSGLQYSIEV